MEISETIERRSGAAVLVQRIVIWLLHHAVTVLMLSTWLIAGPGMAVAWVIEKIGEQLECWEIELESRNRKAR